MKNKGFTLIELLAVIVILAIIALIATPIIIGVINEARGSAGVRGAEFYLDAVKLSLTRANLTDSLGDAICEVQTSGNLDCDGKQVRVDMSNQTATAGTIVIENGQITSVSNLQMGEKFYNKAANSEVVASDTPVAPKFTGTIYRDGWLGSSDGYIGSSISDPVDVWCLVAGDYNLCDETTYFMTHSQSECETTLEGIRSAGGLSAEEQALAQAAECHKESRIAFPRYTTDMSELTWHLAYLKHNVVNGIVTNGYLCAYYEVDNVEKTVCLKGMDPSAYGNENSGNVKILKELEGEGLECSFSSNESYCVLDSGYFIAKSTGDVYYGVCHIYASGQSFCD